MKLSQTTKDQLSRFFGIPYEDFTKLSWEEERELVERLKKERKKGRKHEYEI